VKDLSTAALLLVGSALASAACGDPKGAGPTASASAKGTSTAGDAASSATATTTAPLAPPAAPAPAAMEEVDHEALPAEPERKTLRSAADDPALYANRDFVADHYGVVNLPFPLQLQWVPLPHSRRALLLTGQGPALDRPLILEVEANHTLVWSKNRPLVGTRERARELTLSRGPRGEVLLFWYDEPTKIFAARMWTHEGGIFADFDVLTSEDCDAATVLFWPGQGWVAAVVQDGTLRAQLLSEAHGRRWPGNGVEIARASGNAPRPPGRPKITVVDAETVELAVGARKTKVTADGVLLK
jgi:hypothetical protein